MFNNKHLFGIITFLLLASVTFAQSGTIKYVLSVDYPMGKKAEYIEWVKTIVNTLQEPEEVVSIASYDNYLSTAPHRFVEFEFINAVDAAQYFDRPEIREVIDGTLNHGINLNTKILIKRGDYSAGEPNRGKIKYCYMLDYPVGGKTDYINWVKTIVKDLQEAEGIKRITSYDNYLVASPQRLIEFEFDSVEDATKYLNNPVVKAVFDKSATLSMNSKLDVLSLRSDYSKN